MNEYSVINGKCMNSNAYIHVRYNVLQCSMYRTPTVTAGKSSLQKNPVNV